MNDEENSEPDRESPGRPGPPGPELPPEQPAEPRDKPGQAESSGRPEDAAGPPPERATEPDRPAGAAQSPDGPGTGQKEAARTGPSVGDGPAGAPVGGEYSPGGGDPGGGDEGTAAPAPTGRKRLAAALWPPRVTRPQLIAAVLLFVLGLGLAIQVRSTSESSPLRGARQEDLVRILDELDDRTTRLQEEKQRLEAQRRELENSSDQAEEARRQTMQKKRQLGVLAGTVAAEGPGLRITVTDPSGAVEADMLLDTIQELRAAGAEAIEINDVRVVAGTYFTGSGGDVRIDGKKVDAPYRFLVIGSPGDLQPALNIPGGVVQTLEKEQAGVEVARSENITVDALRKPEPPDYARSSQ